MFVLRVRRSQILSFHKRMSIVTDTLSRASVHLDHFIFVMILVSYLHHLSVYPCLFNQLPSLRLFLAHRKMEVVFTWFTNNSGTHHPLCARVDARAWLANPWGI